MALVLLGLALLSPLVLYRGGVGNGQGPPGSVEPAVEVGIDGTLSLVVPAEVQIAFVIADAGWEDVLGIESPVGGDIFTPCGNSSGAPPSVGLGPLEAGELRFRLRVEDPVYGPQTYYTGPGAVNPDGLVHAKLTMVSPSTVRIAWEDSRDYWADLPALVDGDFNDCVVDVAVSRKG